MDKLMDEANSTNFRGRKISEVEVSHQSEKESDKEDEGMKNI
jgi:hypothetical protein